MTTVSEFMIQRLAEWGVKRLYGYPGDGINAVMAAVATARERGEIEWIQTRHEEMAAFMACAHAKFTGEPGVCVATSGPGAIHLLNGLYDAKLDHVPVVAIVGQADSKALGGSYQQEVDLLTLFRDVAHEFVYQLGAPSQIRHLVDRAMRIAEVERTVTCIILPKDLQEEQYEDPPHEHGTVHSSVGIAQPRVVPQERDLMKAADILNRGEKVAMLIGAGANDAGDEVIEIADKLGAGVAKALLGKQAIPDDHPCCTGPIGLLGTKPSWDMMNGCDTLLMVGTSFPYSEFLPKEGQARAIQIDIDGRLLGIRYPVELNLIGDAKETLRALSPYIQRKEDRAWRSKIEKEMSEWWELLKRRAYAEANPINPQQIYWELSSRLPERSIITSDSGSSAGWFARDLRVRPGMMCSLSGGLATMGSAVPYAVAAKFAFPDRPVVACVGDGAMQMNGINCLITISKYWREWNDPRLVVLVMNNRDLNYVSWEMRAQAGEKRFAASQDVPDFPYAQYAELCGLLGLRIDRPEDIGRAWDIALGADRPVVVDCVVDPEVPPLPPHVTPKQAKDFLSSILHGDERAGRFIKNTFKQIFPPRVDRR